MSLDTPARIAILGAGPIGLEAALYARFLGYDVDIYERGRVAENVLRWGHVRMFTPFGRNCSPLGLSALRAQDPDRKLPDHDALITGRQWAEHYLIPLAKSDLLEDSLREHTEVISVARVGLLKGELVGDESRADGDLRLLLRDAHGAEHYATADAVIDATGTYGCHNWLGDGGIPALGEQAAQSHIEYGLPDLAGADGDRHGGRHTLVIGNGHTAATNVVALAELAHHVPETWITWITRGGDEAPIPLTPGDPLPERDRVARSANRLATGASEHVTFHKATTVEAIVWHADLSRFAVRLTGGFTGELEVDRVIANVGFRPDRRLAAEVQVHECYATDAPRGIALALTGHSPTDSVEPRNDPHALLNPEPDFYILGAKSFGRNSQFFFADGLEQIRQLFTVIGDRATLDLYATAARMT